MIVLHTDMWWDERRAEETSEEKQKNIKVTKSFIFLSLIELSSGQQRARVRGVTQKKIIYSQKNIITLLEKLDIWITIDWYTHT